MEYGALQRREHSNARAMNDTDTSPTWRAMGAKIWDADCVPDHHEEIAASTILTTHLLAVAMLSRKSVHAGESLALGHVGVMPAINALVGDGGGLEAAHEQVKLMSIESRRQTVAECLALATKGFTGLQLDLYAQYQ